MWAVTLNVSSPPNAPYMSANSTIGSNIPNARLRRSAIYRLSSMYAMSNGLSIGPARELRRMVGTRPQQELDVEEGQWNARGKTHGFGLGPGKTHRDRLGSTTAQESRSKSRLR